MLITIHTFKESGKWNTTYERTTRLLAFDNTGIIEEVEKDLPQLKSSNYTIIWNDIPRLVLNNK